MPRVDEGVGGGDVDDGIIIIKSHNNNNSSTNNNNNESSSDQQRWTQSGHHHHHHHHPHHHRHHRQHRSGSFGSWLGGAARAVSSSGTGAGGGYVVLGGTRYGLRLSQESIPPNWCDESQDRGSRDSTTRDSSSSGVYRREKDSSRERLTDRAAATATAAAAAAVVEPTAAEKTSMDLASSVADCCCIGPRSRLPLPRNPLTPSAAAAAAGSVVGDGGGGGGALQSPPLATRGESARLPPNSNANNNRGGLQTGSQQHQPPPPPPPPPPQPQHHHQQQQHQQQQQKQQQQQQSYSQPRSAASSGGGVTCGAGVASTFAPVAQTVSSVPRQIAQWTKHQTLKLQEPAVTAVDRLHRFRWSGGGGGSGKKSSSGPRSEKAERLRELTEKLKGPAPIPPPRRPSRFQASSPPRHAHHPAHALNEHQQSSGASNPSDPQRNESRPANRSYTYSEGSASSFSDNGSVVSHSGDGHGATVVVGGVGGGSSIRHNATPRTFARSESVGEEFRRDEERAPVANDATDSGAGSKNGDARAASAARAASPLSSSSSSLAGKQQQQQQPGVGIAGVAFSGAPRAASLAREKNIVAGDTTTDSTSPGNVEKLSLLSSSSSSSSSCADRNNADGVGVGDPGNARVARNSGLGESSPDAGGKQQTGNCDEGISGAGRARQTESRDALARLEPRGPLLTYHRTGLPYRSASFGQADLNQAGNRQRAQPITSVNRGASVDGSKQVRASTLPRRRGDGGQGSATTPHNSPRASTPSLDSAVGSAEGLGLVAQPLQEETRPRSDGSDSLATSSALTSPEPPAILGEAHQQLPPLRSPPPPPPPPPPLPATQHRYLREENPRAESIGSKVGAPGENPDGQQVVHRGTEHSTEDISSSSPRETWLEPHEVIITPPEEPRLSQTSEGSEATSETPSPEALSPSGKIRRSRGDNSKRRKGVYITQWPEPSENDRSKLAAQSSEEREDPSITWSDLSDCESHTPRRYSKRPLRGPYGQMLEAEMAKPRTTDIALEEGLRPRRKISANLSYTGGTNSSHSEPPTPCHHRTTSSPSKLESLPGPSPELLAELLRGSSERVARAPAHRNDTRNHVVVELYDTERSYVEALQILVTKYLQPLKSPENAGLIDAATVNEIFYQVPAILSHHQIFLEELRKRLETWELHQTIGDIFLQVFTKPNVLETYTLFLDNWKSAEKAIKTTCQAKPAFARFLETLEREHRGKLGLDQLLIKPVQKIPRYELLIQRLLKHTDASHPDHDLLTAAQKEIHELVVKINCTEREILEWEQQQSVLREVESLVEGLAGIVTKDRFFVRHDMVTIASNQGTRKERALFLFSDLLVITNIKRRSGTIRKPSTSASPNSLAGLPEANKYKMLMRISLDDVELIKAKEESLRKMAREVEHLKEDCSTLNQLQELAATLHGTKHQLEELIKEYLGQVQRQLAEKNAAHSQLACLELTLNTQNGVENITIMFTKPETRASWEESFNDAKQKLAMSADRRPPPEFVGPLPIRKTRAGLQFTCAAPTIATGQTPRDVWVCNSDGYVGQICVLSLASEPPHVESCNGVCNARILCIAAIPAPRSSRYDDSIRRRRRRCSSDGRLNSRPLDLTKSGISILVEDADANGQEAHLESSESSEDSDNEDVASTQTSTTTVSTNNPDAAAALSAADLSGCDDLLDEDTLQPTVWLGTEDGCIHIYNCNDNIRIKKNRLKIQHGSSVHSIIYLDNKVFVSLANGDIAVYSSEYRYGWNTQNPVIITVGTPAAPVTKMILISGKLWCGSHNTVRIVNTTSLDIEHSFTVSNDTTRPISSMAASGSLGVWISLHNSAVLRLFHANSYECLTDINIAPAVTKMLASCDDIIRQHKAACLRVTALLSCNELLWVGTSAGVLLNIPIPHLKPSSQRLPQPPPVTGIPHGHTGHVRFLTCVEKPAPTSQSPAASKPEVRQKNKRHSGKSEKSQQSDPTTGKLLIISGGDGYEDFRGPQASVELQAGREDSTNHLLLWKV